MNDEVLDMSGINHAQIQCVKCHLYWTGLCIPSRREQGDLEISVMGKIIHIVTGLAHSSAMRERVADDHHITGILPHQAVIVQALMVEIAQDIGIQDGIGVFRAAVYQSQSHQVARIVIGRPQIHHHPDQQEPNGQHGVGYLNEELFHDSHT